MTRKRPLTAQEDLAEARRRAKAARTPIAKVVTQQLVDKKERTYSGEATAELRAEMRRGAPSVKARTTTPKRGAAAAKKGNGAAAKKAAPKKR
jgi:hypothetical protein